MAIDTIRTGGDMGELDDLTPLAKRLNAATDELNEALQTIEKRLNATGVGVEVWVERARLRESDWVETLDRDNEPTGEKEFTVEELGYGRLGEGWALLVRSRRHVHYPDQSRDIFEVPGSRKPLLRAARELRIAAVPLIPGLIDRLRAESEKVIAAVEKAKKIAESLK